MQIFDCRVKIQPTQIAKTLGSTSIRHRSDAKAPNRCQIDVALRVFVIWIYIHVCTNSFVRWACEKVGIPVCDQWWHIRIHLEFGKTDEQFVKTVKSTLMGYQFFSSVSQNSLSVYQNETYNLHIGRLFIAKYSIMSFVRFGELSTCMDELALTS